MFNNSLGSNNRLNGVPFRPRLAEYYLLSESDDDEAIDNERLARRLQRKSSAYCTPGLS